MVTIPAFIELKCGVKVVTHVKGLTHSKYSTDTGEYYFTIILKNSNKTNPPYPFFVPLILSVSNGPSGFPGGYFHTTF